MTSPLQEARLTYCPPLPASLQDMQSITIVEGEKTSALSNENTIQGFFPNTFGQPLLTLVPRGSGESAPPPLIVGVVLSGGQAPGGHNVIAGIYDALKKINPESTLYGFCNGPDGIIKNKTVEITESFLTHYRNQGGFDMIGSSRTKIETPEQFTAAKETATALNLNGIVIIGGDDSNTNAALLAEYFTKERINTRVVGVPKTIDGDLKTDYIETSFGFDTATKIYSELIGNIARDALSAKKYTFFIRLMGRSASHITLECALQTHPNVVIIGEEIAAAKKTLSDITTDITDVICKRSDKGKNYGIILVPEGLIEFIPEFGVLIAELNTILAKNPDVKDKITYVTEHLSEKALSCFSSIPKTIQEQLLIDRDPHGNVQVSRIETEKLLIATVKEELAKRKTEGTYSGKFSAQNNFFGYEGRSALPSNFDSNYCYSLGHVAAALIASDRTGYMSCIKNCNHPVNKWEAMGIPLTMMMNIEYRQGTSKPVIHKSLVDLQGAPFNTLKDSRNEWAENDHYRYPGPVQFFGNPDITDTTTMTLAML